ncbi:histone-arginine methyltransferase METTL23-like [Mytilus californianus]|uniref:histone-arginine methyltransferase METTL23-like n=1 Tax=Mytilus californianus TaxID=6549 RepID=UPI0022451AF4|nr:histone-arginine methyltransferase METTL23-like [Mytilus californianus]
MSCSKRQKIEKFFKFGSNSENCTVCIPEVLDGNYGMYVWPCSPVLAQYIWYQRSQLKGKTVLEIGAGTSLPGIVAAKCGATVILSDSSDYPQCLENCAATCDSNNLSNITVIGIKWGQFTPELLNLQPVDIILGSDCFFETKDFEDIIVTVAFIMEKRPSTEFWCTYQERSSSRSIEYLLLKWGLECTEIGLETFEADSPTLAESTLPGNHTIHMYIMKKKISSDS